MESGDLGQLRGHMGYQWLRLDLGVRAVWTVFRISGSGSGKSGKTGPGHFFHVVSQMKGLGLLMSAEWSDTFFRINRIRKSGKTGPGHFFPGISNVSQSIHVQANFYRGGREICNY